MSLHLSKTQAEERAMRLADDFMRGRDTNGWQWSLGSASPDSINPDHMERKTPTRWIVVVNYSTNGAVIDGPAALRVNIADGTVTMDESP